MSPSWQPFREWIPAGQGKVAATSSMRGPLKNLVFEMKQTDEMVSLERVLPLFSFLYLMHALICQASRLLLHLPQNRCYSHHRSLPPL